MAHNEIYIKAKQLLSTWNLLDDLPKIAIRQLNMLKNRLLPYILLAFNAPKDPAKKIDIVTNYYDDIILEAAILTENLSNVDNRVFNTIGNIIQSSELPTDFDNPVVRMFTALNNTTISFDEIKSEIAHSLLDYRNPYRIGFETYKTLSVEHTQIDNANLIDYLETERTARQLLFTGNFEQALNKVIELFNSPFSTPEQYVTLALCGYNLGLLEDAKNAVETGLASFPNYGRLEDLLDIINAERNG